MILHLSQKNNNHGMHKFNMSVHVLSKWKGLRTMFMEDEQQQDYFV
jgi:hypothetical protein